jgi:glycosyltransferase involved in cell wall biosynthesis
VTIDIMMPFYGNAALLRTAVASVLAQTDGDWRLTVLDDRYPDPEPGRWVQTITDPRVTYVLNDTNLGVSGNFQRSIDLAKEDFMVIMGCDDVMLPGYVQRMHQLIAMFPEASYVQPDVRVIDSTGAQALPLADRIKRLYRFSVSNPSQFDGERLARSVLRGNWTYFPSICWRTTVLKDHGFRRDLDVTLDLALQLEIVADGGSLVVDSEVAFEYRRHGESVSSWAASDGSRFDEELSVFRWADQIMIKLGWTRAARAARRHYSSRLNALSQLPRAIKARDFAGARSLTAYAIMSGIARPQ